jgi:hypothetical protein
VSNNINEHETVIFSHAVHCAHSVAHIVAILWFWSTCFSPRAGDGYTHSDVAPGTRFANELTELPVWSLCVVVVCPNELTKCLSGCGVVVVFLGGCGRVFDATARVASADPSTQVPRCFLSPLTGLNPVANPRCIQGLAQLAPLAPKELCVLEAGVGGT